MKTRFDAFQDPVNNWIVWDCESNAIVTINSREAIFTNREAAEKCCAIFNSIDGSQALRILPSHAKHSSADEQHAGQQQHRAGDAINIDRMFLQPE
jgi:hypothetical protein